MIGIYIIKNVINHKTYIGQSIRRKYRLNGHKALLLNQKHPNAHLQRAWNKYGEKAFVFNNWVRCSKDDLDRLEKIWIKYYKLKGLSYNLDSGGNLNKQHSIETKMKISMSSKGRKRTKRSIQKQIDRQKGKKLSRATREKLKKNHSGFTGKCHSEKTKNKISKTLCGHLVSLGTRIKLSQSLKGRIKPAEEIEKMRESLRGHKISQETKDKISKALTGIKRSKETKAKLSKTKRKLNDKQIAEIKFFREQGKTYKELGIMYNVTSATIYNNCRRCS